MSVADEKINENEGIPKALGTQTMLRGLRILECVAGGITDAKGIARKLGTPRSTVHRMLNSLVNEGYLHNVPYHGYSLGYKLILLGTRAREQRPLAALAQPYLEELAAYTGDTAHLGTREGTEVFYLSKVSGGKGLEMRSRIGQHMPLASTGVGKALMLGIPADQWRQFYDAAAALRKGDGERPKMSPWRQYLKAMQEYARQGWVMDMEENEIGIRCVGAPVYDVNGDVVAAISVASVIFYMPESRMLELGPKVLQTARHISAALGAER